MQNFIPYFHVRPLMVIAFGFLLTTYAGANPLRNFFEEKVVENSQIVEAQQNLRIAESSLSSSRSSFYPKLSTSWVGNQNNQRSFGNLLSVRGEQSLFAGGAEYPALRSASLQVEAAEHGLADAKDRIAAQYGNLISQLSAQQERIYVLRKIKSVQQERIKELSRRLQLGQSREPDLLQAQVEDSRLDRRIIDIESSLDAIEQQLRNLLNLDEQELATLLKHINLQAVNLLVASLEPRQDYHLRSLRLKNEALLEKERATERSAWPSLSLYGQSNLVRPTPVTNEWEWGLQAQWVFYEGKKNSSRVEAAAAERIVSEKAYVTAEFNRKITEERLNREYEKLEIKKRGVEADILRAQRALTQQQRDYRLGTVSELEVQQTLQSVLDLDFELINIASAKRSLKLQRVVGGEALL